MKTKQGFTLIELLIVIAIIAILAVVIFVALDPLTRFQKARDAQRWSDVEAILSAIKLDQVDNGGTYDASVSGLTTLLNYTIGTAASGCDAGCTAVTTQAACADLTPLTTAGYLASIPTDPTDGTAAETDYYISRNGTTGIITVGSCDPEDAATIAISR